MKYDLKQWVVWGFLFALTVLTVTAQQLSDRFDELPNFAKVDERLYRGGQPKTGGLERLAEMKIKTILNLRTPSLETEREREEARSLGMKYFNIPLARVNRPSGEDIKKVLAVIEDPANAPIFIHCKHGADRTGVLIAHYRITHDKWTAEQAIEEADRLGMGFIQFRKRGYIKDLYKQQQSVGN
jgi:protein tyrosine/serine phosphatase